MKKKVDAACEMSAALGFEITEENAPRISSDRSGSDLGDIAGVFDVLKNL